MLVELLGAGNKLSRMYQHLSMPQSHTNLDVENPPEVFNTFKFSNMAVVLSLFCTLELPENLLKILISRILNESVHNCWEWGTSISIF